MGSAHGPDFSLFLYSVDRNEMIECRKTYYMAATLASI